MIAETRAYWMLLRRKGTDDDALIINQPELFTEPKKNKKEAPAIVVL